MTDQPSAIESKGPLQQAEIDVFGLVQGVNFRYIFKRHAYRNRLKGRIWNDPINENCVHIIVEGPSLSIDQFIGEIEKYRKVNLFSDGMAPVTSLIEVASIEVKYKTIQGPTFTRFEVYCPELQNTDQVLISILEKLSMGGALYQRFHQDHTTNFQTLDDRYLRIHDGVERANRTLKEIAETIRS